MTHDHKDLKMPNIETKAVPGESRPMLRPLDTAREIRAGTDDPIVKMHGCPDCSGRGWFCENPFASFNKKYLQCPTCLSAKQHFDKHGSLPDDIAAAMAG